MYCIYILFDGFLFLAFFFCTCPSCRKCLSFWIFFSFKYIKYFASHHSLKRIRGFKLMYYIYGRYLQSLSHYELKVIIIKMSTAMKTLQLPRFLRAYVCVMLPYWPSEFLKCLEMHTVYTHAMTELLFVFIFRSLINKWMECISKRVRAEHMKWWTNFRIS